MVDVYISILSFIIIALPKNAEFMQICWQIKGGFVFTLTKYMQAFTVFFEFYGVRTVNFGWN